MSKVERRCEDYCSRVCYERDNTVVPVLCHVLLFVQDINNDITLPLAYLSCAPDPDDDLMELPEDCRVMM